MGKDADCCDACRMFGGEQAQGPPPVSPTTPARADQIKLVADGREGPQEIVPRGTRITVGRGSQCDIQFKDMNLSRVQCILVFDEHGIFVEDNRSACGTYVDGRKIKAPTRVHVGTKIYFGDSVLRVEAR